MRTQHYIKRVPRESINDNRRAHESQSASAARTLRDLIAALTLAVEASETVAARDVAFIRDGIDFFAEVDRFEIKMITQALRLARGSQIRAARLLGLNATTLNSKIKTLNIDWKTGDEQANGSQRWPENSKERIIQTER